jgi:hypothetical protein
MTMIVRVKIKNNKKKKKKKRNCTCGFEERCKHIYLNKKRPKERN